jgi:hypothetical protein
MERISRLMTEPAAGLAPIRTAMRGNVNARYSALPDTLATKMLAHGGARSGKFGTAMRQSEMARLGELGDVESTIAQMILDQQQEGASLAERLLSQNFGQTTETTGRTDETSRTILPGSAAAGGIVGGLQGMNTALIQYMMLNRLLGGSRSPGQAWSGAE